MFGERETRPSLSGSPMGCLSIFNNRLFGVWIYDVFWSPWCKYSHCGCFQAKDGMSLSTGVGCKVQICSLRLEGISPACSAGLHFLHSAGNQSAVGLDAVVRKPETEEF